MKLEGYEYVVAFATPNYWYEEGKKHEEYWVDAQNLFYYKFLEEPFELGIEDKDGNKILDENGKPKKDPRKWWLISPYKPIGTTITNENAEELIKWCVEMCYLDNGKKNYEFYEWDFEKHCIKI